MKAVEYYNQFISLPTEENAKTIFNKYIDEVVETIKKRNAKKDSSVCSVIKELNRKWNSMITIFAKNHQLCPFEPDAIWNYYAIHIPEMNKYK